MRKAGDDVSYDSHTPVTRLMFPNRRRCSAVCPSTGPCTPPPRLSPAPPTYLHFLSHPLGGRAPPPPPTAQQGLRALRTWRAVQCACPVWSSAVRCRACGALLCACSGAVHVRPCHRHPGAAENHACCLHPDHQPSSKVSTCKRSFVMIIFLRIMMFKLIVKI